VGYLGVDVPVGGEKFEAPENFPKLGGMVAAVVVGLVALVLDP
jgi:hypothetical protein